jgi:hypothetical protein
MFEPSKKIQTYINFLVVVGGTAELLDSFHVLLVRFGRSVRALRPAASSDKEISSEDIDNLHALM